ncbi:MAG TPA: hypothetical protein VF230_10030 [Acidimicrobiales bacterium]
MRRVLLVLACAATLVAGLSLPARASHEQSHLCSDNSPPNSEIHLIGDPITLNAELYTGGPTYFQVCYSTDKEGSGATSVIGGRLIVSVEAGQLNCLTDGDGVAAFDCNVHVTPTGIVVSVQPRIQSTTVLAEVGVVPGGVGSGPACYSGLTITLNGTTVFGPNDIGVC